MELAERCRAALAGIAVGDALGKMTEPAEWVEIVERENSLDFAPLAEQLAALRR